MATIIYSNGETTEILPMNGNAFLLEELQSAIESEAVQLLMLNDGSYLIVDDIGISKGLPPNIIASRMYDDLIVGAVIHCGKNEIQ